MKEKPQDRENFLFNVLSLFPSEFLIAVRLNFRPEVDLGNLIIDLDADIDKTMSNNSAATPSTTSTNSGSIPAGATINVPVAGGSATAVLTESVAGSLSSASDKSLKMKIKRMKSGSRGNTEGKLEIVPQSDSPDGGGFTGSASVSNGSPDPIGLSAAEIVAAVKQNVKPSGNLNSTGSGKVRLTSAPSTSSSSSASSSSSSSSSSTHSAVPAGTNGAKKSTTIPTTPGVGTISTSSATNKIVEKSNGASNSAKPTFAAATPIQSTSTASTSAGNTPSGSSVVPTTTATAPQGTGNGSVKVHSINNKQQQQQQQQPSQISSGNSTKPIYAPQSTSKANNEPPSKRQKVQTSFFFL